MVLENVVGLIADLLVCLAMVGVVKLIQRHPHNRVSIRIRYYYFKYEPELKKFIGALVKFYFFTGLTLLLVCPVYLFIVCPSPFGSSLTAAGLWVLVLVMMEVMIATLDIGLAKYLLASKRGKHSLTRL